MNMPQKYETIPVAVEAIQWTGENIDAASAFCPYLATRRQAPDLQRDAEIRWKNGGHISVRPGNWIVWANNTFDVLSNFEFEERYRLKT